MKGYKVFNPDWTCRGFQYEIGGIYVMSETPVCCKRGFHFCTDLKDCFDYYGFNPVNKVAEIEATGAISTDNGRKHCTNQITIIRELSWHEVLDMVNTGKDCTGRCNSGNRNSGNRNSGNCNSGDWNSGDCNSGDCNSGDCNSGNWNSGNRNSGNWNSGDCNSGNCNSGDWNSGDWNCTSFSSGCFNTIEGKILMFNKPSDWTYRDWINSKARYLLNHIPSNILQWVYAAEMTDEEKAQHPEYETTGGYLKTFKKTESAQMWYDGLSDQEKDTIKSLPNFDADIFEEITGIGVFGRKS